MKFYFKQMLKVSAFYLEKQKSFIPKKNFKPYSVTIQKMALAVLIFSEGFDTHLLSNIDIIQSLITCNTD